MRMRIYINRENNQLEAYVLADEGRALSGQKKSIRAALPECVAELRRMIFGVPAHSVATMHVDGYGSIVVAWYRRVTSNDVLLSPVSRERLSNRRLARNKDVAANVSDADALASALATVLRNEAACRRANDLDTSPRFEYPAESRDCTRVASWQSTRWTHPTALVATDDDDNDDATTPDVAQVETATASDVAVPETDAADDVPTETVIVEPVEVEHDGVVDVEMAETAEIPAVEADTAATVEVAPTPTAKVDQAETVKPEPIGLPSGYYRETTRGVLWYVGETPLAVWVCVAEGGHDERWACAPMGFKSTPAWNARVRQLAKVLAPVAAPYEPAECMRTSFVRNVTDAERERGWMLMPDGVAYRSVRATDVEPAPRAVQSSPALPAECEAVTTVIPEVPPTPNADAHVLAVSEHVIPTGQSVTDAYGVAYRAVHYVRRVVEHPDGTTTKKKVAAVFRLGDTVHVVRRDRYENAGRDAAVEAEIAAQVARLQRAA